MHLVGNSMGGAVSVRVAARRPDLVQTLTLVSPALPDRRSAPLDGALPSARAAVRRGVAARRWASAFPAENRVSRRLQQAASTTRPRVHPDRFAAEVERAAPARRARATARPRSSAPRARWSARRSAPAPLSLGGRPRGSTAPSWSSSAATTGWCSPALAVRAARAFRNARVWSCRIGHIGQMERPDLVAARFREMVERDRECRDPARDRG